MCLRFVFLLITRMTSWLLSRQEEAWKTAEILLLRHQLAVLHRRQPRLPNLDWADRALLATLCVPKTSSTSCDQAIFVDQASDVSVFPETISRSWRS
jgi:hypothetical protein